MVFSFLFLSRRVENAVESTSPEKHLSGAVDAVKSETECLDRVTPLKVFLSPRESLRRNIQSKVLHLANFGNKFDWLLYTLRGYICIDTLFCILFSDNNEPAVQEISTPRRSTRLRGLNNSPVVPTAGRASLLQTTSVTPSENLISLD